MICPIPTRWTDNPHVSFDRLLDLLGQGNREPEALSSLASRLTRLDRKLTPT